MGTAGAGHIVEEASIDNVLPEDRRHVADRE